MNESFNPLNWIENSNPGQREPAPIQVNHATTDLVEKALSLIESANDGEKHSTLLRASCLLGKSISEIFTFDDAYKLLKEAIDRKPNIQSYKAAYKTISDGLNFGMGQRNNDNHQINRKNTTDTIAQEVQKLYFNTPVVPENVYSNLPKFLSDFVSPFQEPTDRDVLLISGIGVMSGCVPNVKGVYFERDVYPNLNVFIVAPAAAGKGVMYWAKILGSTIHAEKVEKSQNAKELYNLELERYKNLSRKQKLQTEIPKKPTVLLHFIPANSSASAISHVLDENSGRGIIFETEADTLSGTLKQDWGNFSDILRKSFHHEPISIVRRKDDEYLEIKSPALSVVLSGTPGQVISLIPETENGLLSRFIFYAFGNSPTFRDPFAKSGHQRLEDLYTTLADKMKQLYDYLSSLVTPIVFELTNEQQKRFMNSFQTRYNENIKLAGDDMAAFVKRLGLICFRIAMIFTVIRNMELIIQSNPGQAVLYCDDRDFESALTITSIMQKHALAIYMRMDGTSKIKGIPLEFYNSLPHQFDRQTSNNIANELNINLKTAEKYLERFRKENLVSHEQNLYIKINEA